MIAKRRKIQQLGIWNDDVFRNILSRLSAKPLMRFRCVSKHWNNIITDSYFIDKVRSRRMILVSNVRVFACDVKGGSNVNHNYPPFDDDKKIILKVIVVGTFKGIVVLALKMFGEDYPAPTFILYNPLTRAIKKLPQLPSWCCSHSTIGEAYGFVPDDLNIVFGLPDTCYHVSSSKCHVFSLKKGLWTTPRTTLQHQTARDIVGVFLNGYLYWVSFQKIVALDVKEMVVSTIGVPTTYQYMYDKLGTLHGYLCLITKWDYGFNVWLMKENKTWSKEYCFTLGVFSTCVYKNLHAICILEDGRIVMKDNMCRQLIICDPSKGSFHVFPCNIYMSMFNYSIEYVESLVSPSDICHV